MYKGGYGYDVVGVGVRVRVITRVELSSDELS